MPEYRFDEIAILRNEKRTPVPEDKYTYVGLEHLDSGKLEVTRWGSEVDIKGEKLVMHKGDILFGRRNTYLKRAAIAPHDGLFSAHGMIFRPNTKVISERLFPFFIASDYFMDAAIRISVGSLSPTVNWKTLRELRFKLPPLDQQNELADLMQAANDTKVAYEQMLLQLDELVKSQFIEMVQPMIDAGETTPLVDLIRPDRPVTYGILKPGTNVEGGIPVIRVKDYPNGEIIQEDMLHTTPEIDAKYVRSHLLPGDLLLSIGGSVGRMAIVPPELEGANITQHTARLSFAEKVLTKYVMGVLEMPSLQHIMESQIKGVAQKGLNLADVKQFPIPVPSIGTQQRLVDIYDQSDKSKFELKQAIERVTNLMKSLMQQDFVN